MPTFNYEAADWQGSMAKGHLEAETIDAAGQELKRRGLVPLELKSTETAATGGHFRGTPPRWSIDQKILFTRKFASLIKAGIPLLTVIEMISRQTRAPRVADALSRAGDSIANGKTLFDALAAFPSLFDTIYLGTVRAGEATGRLDDVLEHLAAFLERELDTRRKIKEALRYPIMVIAAIVFAGAVVLKFVVPQFLSFYHNYGGQLPAPTRALMMLSQLTSELWWLSIPVAGVAWAAWRWLNTSPRGSLWRDRIIIQLPLAGTLLLKVAVGRFARLFGVLYSAGIPATTALATVAEGIGNRVVAGEVQAMGQRLATGGTIVGDSSAAVIPNLVYQMIGIGFESGEVERMLSEVARHYEQEIDYDVRKITDRLQPILLLFLAAGVLSLALAVLLPLWNLTTLFRP